MDLDLVGYLFGLLDPEDRVRTEDALRSNPAARAELDRLRTSVAPLAMAREDVMPPTGLADRTIARIASYQSDGVVHIVAAARAPRSYGGDREPVFAASRWGRMDVAIAASIMILVGGLAVSGLGRVQREQDKIRCQNSLRQLGNSLVSYSGDHNGRLPQVNDRPPMNLASSFVPMLQEGGYLPAAGLPNCPLVNVVAGEPNTGGYAYSLGYRGPDGQLHGFRISDGDLRPIMADRPTPVSHGNGHNVLFIGGNVRYCTSPNVGVGGDHIFLNQANQIAAGLNLDDSVIAVSPFSP